MNLHRCIVVLAALLASICPLDEIHAGARAVAEARVEDGKLIEVIVSNGGSGYVIPPEIHLCGSGTGAELRAQIENGSVVGVEVLVAGIQYQTPPQVIVDGPPPRLTASREQYNIVIHLHDSFDGQGRILSSNTFEHRRGGKEVATVLSDGRNPLKVSVPIGNEPQRYFWYESVVATPSGMGSDFVRIPEGNFQMGNPFENEGDSFGPWWSDSEKPVHTVYVSEFFMEKYEVTQELWESVKEWALSHGYEFSGYTGEANEAREPIRAVTWFDAVKWCNARSEMDGLSPVYFLEAEHTTIFRKGVFHLYPANVDWCGSGYRLPTEAEWEKAARGGLKGKRFPWGNTITEKDAAFDVPSWSYHPWDRFTEWLERDYRPYKPVGSFPANDYGLYDMIGNASEWCWDWWYPAWYPRPEATLKDTPGPSFAFAPNRVIRGGSAGYDPDTDRLRVSSRHTFPVAFDFFTGRIFSVESGVGFRCVRRR